MSFSASIRFPQQFRFAGKMGSNPLCISNNFKQTKKDSPFGKSFFLGGAGGFWDSLFKVDSDFRRVVSFGVNIDDILIRTLQNYLVDIGDDLG